MYETPYINVGQRSHKQAISKKKSFYNDISRGDTGRVCLLIIRVEDLFFLDLF